LSYIISSRKQQGFYTQWVDASYTRSRLLPRIIIQLDPRINFLNIIKKYISREEFMEKKQFVKRFVQLHLGFIVK